MADPIPAASGDQSIRPFLHALHRSGELLRVGQAVSPHFELSALLSAADAGPALLFDQVQGSPLRAVGNLLNSRARIAQALGVGADRIQGALADAIARPVAPEWTTHAPVQAVVERQTPLAGLPIPTFFEHERRPYITAGVIVARDPDTGRGNASFARLGVLDGRSALIGIAPNHHLGHFTRRAAALGRPLEIAVVIGAHPAIQLAACLYLGLGDDELECAGRFLGAPVRLARALTLELGVPADAEVVLEGHVHDEPVEEGFISEYHGMYEDYGPGLKVSFDCMTRRQDAIFQVIEPGLHREHIYLGAVSIAASLKSALARALPNVGEIAVTPAGGGRTDIVIQLDRPRPGQARRAMFAAWAAVSMVKRITVVDTDIDPWDGAQVEWARMSRMRVERDLVIVPEVITDRNEPQQAGGTVTKIGLDATVRADDRRAGMARAEPPPQYRAEAARQLAGLLRAGARPLPPGIAP